MFKIFLLIIVLLASIVMFFVPMFLIYESFNNRQFSFKKIKTKEDLFEKRCDIIDFLIEFSLSTCISISVMCLYLCIFYYAVFYQFKEVIV